MQSAVRTFGIIAILILSVALLQAQAPMGVLHGQVTDPTGAVVTQATVTITAANGQKTTVTTNGKGGYEAKLVPGKYSLRVTAKGFAAYDLADVTVTTGATPSLDIGLSVATTEQQVLVQDENTSVSTDSSSNGSAVVIKDKDLDALSDDPDDLQSDLEALAGPSAGPNGGQIYIDGFSNGQLPPKSSIREIRINQNPFSAQYDRLGFGRVEVFTKPGKDSYHGQFMTNLNRAGLNSRNKFLPADTEVPDYHSEMYNGSFSGPINSKSSFFFNFRRRDMSEVTIASKGWVPCDGFDITQPCSSFSPQSYGNVYKTPQVNTEFGPRVDYQLTTNNTLTARYEYEKSSNTNNGIGQFSLPSQLNVNSNYNEHNLQLSDTQVINSTMINETRFQFDRENSEQNDRSATALAGLPSLSVMDSFSGGTSSGNSRTTQSHYELQNYTSKVLTTHFIRFGGRLRVNTQDSFSAPNQFGSFSYASPTAYYLVNFLGANSDLSTLRNGCNNYIAGTNPSFVNGWAVGSDGKPLVPYPTVSTDCGISQFTQTTGNDYASVSQTDAGLYAEDDWRIRPSFTLSYGLRFETQNNVSNHFNFAPRLGIAWGLGKGGNAKTVLRAGFGMFYDRFSQGNVFRVIQTNSANPQINNVYKDPNSTDPSVIIQAPQDSNDSNPPQKTIYEINPHLQIPYTMQVAASVDQQLTKTAKLTVSYIGTRGLHQIAQEDIWNFDPAANLKTNYYTYESAGTFKQNQLIVNTNITKGRYLSLMGWYVLSYASANTSGGLPTEPFDLALDWGRSSWDVRNRGFIMGTVNLPYGFRLNPMIIVSSGRPYNIYGPKDINQDNNQKNDRPWFSTGCDGILPGKSVGNIYNTSLGCFSMDENSPMNLGRVPVNYLMGPSSFMTNLRISKTFGFGKKSEGAGGNAGGGGGGRHGGPGGMPGGHDMGRMMGGGSSGQRYTLTLSAFARNLFNNVNAATPSGNLSSPNFAQETALSAMGPFSGAANRRVDFQLQFSF